MQRRVVVAGVTVQEATVLTGDFKSNATVGVVTTAVENAKKHVAIPS